MTWIKLGERKEKEDDGFRGGVMGGRRYKYHDSDEKGASILVPSGFDELGRPVKFAIKKLKPLNPRMSMHDEDGFSDIYTENDSNVVWPDDYWWCHECAHGWSAMTIAASAMGARHAFETGHHMICCRNGKRFLRLVGGIPKL